MTKLVPQEMIEKKIFLIRGHKVMLDSDLATLYDVPTKALNQAVKRNRRRFPADFMFRLTEKEKTEVVTNCDHLNSLKFSPNCPYAFTEQGVAMLSSVLNSERSIQVNIAIMRTFVKLREILSTNALLRRKIESLERKYDEKFQQVFTVLQYMLKEETKPKEPFGFRSKKKTSK